MWYMPIFVHAYMIQVSICECLLNWRQQLLVVLAVAVVEEEEVEIVVTSAKANHRVNTKQCNYTS